MKQEIKICLPFYKVMYSLAYMVILSLIRGISFAEEIGGALDPNAALLAIVFCADTYVMERSGKRWEIFSLYAMKKKTKMIFRRMAVQIGYLCLISYVGYFFFYWQRPMVLYDTTHARLYGNYLIAVTATVIFWSFLSVTAADFFRNQWAGIGICVGLWLGINSVWGNEVLGHYNIFAFVFRELGRTSDFSWIWGKALGVILAVIMAGTIPWMLARERRQSL